MNFRSLADLAHCIRRNAGRLPDDIDLVVGIPRSGQLAASLIALSLNLKLTDLQGLLHNVPLPANNIRTSLHPDLAHPHEARHILLVDDSIRSGKSMADARQLLSTLPGLARISSFCASIRCCREQRTRPRICRSRSKG